MESPLKHWEEEGKHAHQREEGHTRHSGDPQSFHLGCVRGAPCPTHAPKRAAPGRNEKPWH